MFIVALLMNRKSIREKQREIFVVKREESEILPPVANVSLLIRPLKVKSKHLS
jgi:hypothetical protein